MSRQCMFVDPLCGFAFGKDRVQTLPLPKQVFPLTVTGQS